MASGGGRGAASRAAWPLHPNAISRIHRTPAERRGRKESSGDRDPGDTRRVKCGLALVAVAIAACSDRSAKQQPPPAPAVPADAAPGTLSLETARVLFEGIEICAIEPRGVDHECPANTALNYAYHDERAGDGAYEIMQTVARKMLTHRSAAVRLAAFQWITKVGEEPEVTRAIALEEDPDALVAKLFHATVSFKGDPSMYAVVFAHLDHPDPRVRRAALAEIADVYNAADPQLLDAIVDRIDHDPDPGVRGEACHRLGLLRDPRSVPVHDRMLVAATPPPLFDSCAVGLVASWYGDLADEHPVEAAYRRTLLLLRDGPHRPGAPGVDTIDWVRGVSRDHRTFEDRASWVDVAEVRAALGAFVAAPRADREARRLAAEAIAELGAPVPELRALRERVRDRGAAGDEIRELLEDAESWVE